MYVIKIGKLCLPMSGNTTLPCAIKRGKQMNAKSFSIYKAQRMLTFAMRDGKYYDVSPKAVLK